MHTYIAYIPSIQLRVHQCHNILSRQYNISYSCLSALDKHIYGQPACHPPELSGRQHPAPCQIATRLPLIRIQCDSFLLSGSLCTACHYEYSLPFQRNHYTESIVAGLCQRNTCNVFVSGEPLHNIPSSFQTPNQSTAHSCNLLLPQNRILSSCSSVWSRKSRAVLRQSLSVSSCL